MNNNLVNEQIVNIIELFNLLNVKYFDSTLELPIIQMISKKGAKGYFSAFSYFKGDAGICEIALNPVHFNRDEKEVISTLLHEMFHLWQFNHGTPGKGNYHNKEFSEKMLTAGLETFDIYSKKRTGNYVTHRILEGKSYDLFYNEILSKMHKWIILTYNDNDIVAFDSSRKRKIKYTCK